MILLSRSSGKKSQEIWTIFGDQYDKKAGPVHSEPFWYEIFINFQYIRELNYLIVELRWVAQAPTC